MVEQRPLHLPNNPNQREASLIVTPRLKFHDGTYRFLAIPPVNHISGGIMSSRCGRALRQQ